MGIVTGKGMSQMRRSGNKARAHAAQEKIIQEAALAPDLFQFAAKHPQHQHVDQ
jgi:hypothetical protein